MANYGIKQFNYQNVVNYKNSLISNREQMNDLYNKYKNELVNMESNWIGQSGNVSREDMSVLMTQYNEFLNKVDVFINLLSESERTFSETEKQNISTYTN